jgi:DNA-binding MarR family transcriptional regulator
VDPIEELRYLVLAAQRDGSRQLAEALRPLGVTPAQAEVVTVLRSAGRPLSVRELGDLLVCETGSPSRLVRSVVDAGWARTAPDGTDARVSRIELTATGETLAGDVGEVEAGFHRRLAETLAAAGGADRLVAALRALVGDGPSGRALAQRRALATR